jgi:hypothetical protein
MWRGRMSLTSTPETTRGRKKAPWGADNPLLLSQNLEKRDVGDDVLGAWISSGVSPALHCLASPGTTRKRRSWTS